MKLLIAIRCDRDEFYNEEFVLQPEPELARILHQLAGRLETGESIDQIAKTPIKNRDGETILRMFVGY